MKQLHAIGVAAAVLAAAGLAAPAAAQTTINPGFEDAGGFPFAALGWTTQVPVPASQVSRSDELVKNGAWALKLFGQFISSPNASFVGQDLTAVPGERFTAVASAGQLSTDPLAAGTSGYFSIEFWDTATPTTSDFPIQITSTPTTLPGGPTDVFTDYALDAVAPANAVIARIVVGHFQDAANGGGASHYDDAEMTNTGPNTAFQNAGFDSFVPNDPANGDFGPSILFVPGWERPGGNIGPNAENPRTASNALIMFGAFSGVEQADVIWQDVDVTPGDLIEFSSWASHLTGDPVAGGNLAFMNLEFYDAADNLLTITSVDLVDAFSPLDLYYEVAQTATAPAAASYGRFVFGFFQDAAQSPGAAYVDDTEIASLGPNTGLVNPGFETFVPTDPANGNFEPSPTSPLPGWSTAGVNFGNPVPNVGADPVALSGNLSAYMFGQFNGTANDTVLFQDIPVGAGKEVTVDANVLLQATTTASVSQLALNIEFLDGSQNPLGLASEVALNAGSPQSSVVAAQTVGVSPPGTAAARVAFVLSQDNDEDFTVLIDDLAVAIADAPPACPGDVNGDGQTDVSDFFALGGNFGTASGATRADGDLNGDGAVDVSDFFILGGDFGCPNN